MNSGSERNTDNRVKMIDDVLDEVRQEALRAAIRHGAMRSAHEGFAIILEEVDELWDEVKVNDLDRARAEAVQVAAMGVRFILDI